MQNWQELFHAVMQADQASWRQSAWDQFTQSGFPTRRNEAWKYTDTSAIAKTEFSLPAKISEVSLPDKLPNTLRLVFVNGVFSKAQSDSFDDGVIVEPVLAALEKYDLGNSLSWSIESPFAVLNNALLQEGFYIRVKKNHAFKKTIHLLHVQTVTENTPVQSMRHIVHAQENSQLCLYEEYLSLSNDEQTYFNNVCTQIYADKGAKIVHYRLQNEGDNAYHIGYVNITQLADASVETYHFNLGAQLARHDLHYALQEKGAHAKMIGLYCANGKQHLDSHTQVNHNAAHCTSDQLYRGVMSGQSHAVFNGKILVKQDAQKTAAYLNNRNLLLSKNAQVDTKPELEIYADDVKCAHGATVGCIDPNALFYLRSRGIDHLTAQRLLIQAFVSELLEQLPNADIQSTIQSAVMNAF